VRGSVADAVAARVYAASASSGRRRREGNREDGKVARSRKEAGTTRGGGGSQNGAAIWFARSARVAYTRYANATFSSIAVGWWLLNENQKALGE